MTHHFYIILALVLLASCGQPISNADEQISADSSARTLGAVVDLEEHETVENAIDTLSESLKALVPSGYSVMQTSSGDLNGDGFTDRILVLETTNHEAKAKDTTLVPNKRPLLLFLGQSDGSYKLEVRNDNIISAVDGGGMLDDPFVGIAIHNGLFSIEHGVAGGQHWKNTITFRYDHASNDWLLHEDHFVSYKFNESDDPDAEALVVANDTLKTEKDFGVISIDHYQYD